MGGPVRYLIVSLVAVLVVALLRQASSKPAQSSGGVATLRYPFATRVSLTAMAVGLAGVAVLGLLGIVGGAHESRTTVVLCSSALLMVGVVVILELNFVWIEVDEVGLVHRSPWRKCRRIPWAEVQGCSRSDFNGWLSVETSQGRVRVSDLMLGSKEFTELIAAWLAERPGGGPR